MRKGILLLFLIIAVTALATWAVLRFVAPGWQRQSINNPIDLTTNTDANLWAEAIEKIKADRGEPAGGNAAVNTPPELKHYSDRHWFLATQVAEIDQHHVKMCQDYVELAAMIERREMVSVPAVTDTYVLYGVGEKADDPMKVDMLRSLRPEALKILEQVASAYHRQFDRPLPVSSLVRPEEYQHALNRSNRNAVLIDTPPHTTGLAFDIDYRYMSAAEQTFLMAELARLKREGRIEAIRERNANYHVFAFINGTRPSDELIAASLDKATLGDHEAHHATSRSAKAKNKSPKNRTAKARRPRSNTRANRSRRR
jgi:uncharacterized protein DUF5715